MAKQLIFNEEARKKMLSGVEQIAQAVKVTLGPCGRLVMLDKKFGAPTITKDGVSVAKEVELKDPYENMGAQSPINFLLKIRGFSSTYHLRRGFCLSPSRCDLTNTSYKILD